MRAKGMLLALALPICLTASTLPVRAATDWAGVDEKVVAKFAHEAGRPPREPLINTDRGDLLLFVFLVAGAVGGFVAGYCFRALFPPGGARKA
jgi:ABC-type cobalt transport system substrate-binding protein